MGFASPMGAMDSIVHVSHALARLGWVGWVDSSQLTFLETQGVKMSKELRKRADGNPSSQTKHKLGI